MTLYALDDVDDALAVTREFLAPADRTAWLKLAVVVFFLGTPGMSTNALQFNAGGGDGGPPPGDVADLGPDAWLLVGGVVAAALLVVLAFRFVGSVMEFVFVESLRSREVRIRRYWSRRWRQGVRLFGFRLVVGVVVLGTVLLLSALFLLPLLGPGEATTAPGALAFVLLLPVFLVLGVLVGLVDGFTTVFVVPVMVLEDCGVLAGWRRLWPTVVGQWPQYLAYAVAGVLLSVLGGVLVGLATAVLALLLLVPFGVLLAAGVALLLVVEPLGVAVLVVSGLLYGLAVLLAAALVQVPVQTYLRYYALLVLGDVDPDLDLLPEQRATVRE